MLVVQKYGGTSLGTPRRIQKAADRIADRYRSGDRVTVVVSAMGQTTDQLQDLAGKITSRPSRRETDMLLTAGERISMALLSMALGNHDVPAISFTGSQSGIITDTRHTRARILELRPLRIGPELDKGKVVIVAGFQGVSREKEVTTLGRGGSDTTAVALALGLKADACEIYTDVPGVMTADPRLVPEGKLVPRVTWDTMLELSACGAGVIHSRAVELARRHRLPFQVRSAFQKKDGTMVDGTAMEGGPEVAAVSGLPRVARIHLSGLAPGSDRSELYAALDTLFDDVSGMHQYESQGTSHVVFHVPMVPEVENLMEQLGETAKHHGGTLHVETEHAAVSVVGTGLLDPVLVSSRAYRVLTGAGIVPHSVISGNLSLTFLVPREKYAETQKLLHREFLER